MEIKFQKIIIFNKLFNLVTKRCFSESFAILKLCNQYSFRNNLNSTMHEYKNGTLEYKNSRSKTDQGVENSK